MPHDPLVPLRGPIPLECATPGELARQIRAATASPIVGALLEAMDGALLVLNGHRQIVAGSVERLAGMPEASREQVLGSKPGEALNCKYAGESPGGCGAAEACRTCGALRAILRCQDERAAAEDDCLITAGADERSFEFRVRASPVELDGQPFTVVALRDASDERRRAALEQVFFHDLLNTFSSLSVSSQLLTRASPEGFRSQAERVAGLVARAEAEIRSERDLLLAERHALEPRAERVLVDDVLRDLASAYENHRLAENRELVVEPGNGLELETDRSILVRVLANMVTNGLEATREGGRVRAWVEPVDGSAGCRFRVHNEAAIERRVAARIFQRSFSTKAGKGRGLGTYGMKLLGERCLGGRVEFTTSPEAGTTFSVTLPARRTASHSSTEAARQALAPV